MAGGDLNYARTGGASNALAEMNHLINYHAMNHLITLAQRLLETGQVRHQGTAW